MTANSTYTCEIVAIGTELLLGQIVDTNSAWLGEQLALGGIDTHFQTKVGDNPERMKAAIELALSRSDAVICSGGLGPTHDDITREVIADVLDVPLERHDDIVERIQSRFLNRGREMPANNLRQADVPVGASVNPAMPGTAPGLICPHTTADGAAKVIYAVPGVPYEMEEMFEVGILPDLQERAGVTAVIKSRTLKTWGQSESGLGETLADEIDRLDAEGSATIAFLASGWNGLKVRITAKAASEIDVVAILDDEEARVRAIIGEDIVFAVDDDTMESVVLDLCRARGLSLGVAESLTGGLIGARITDTPGSSDVFRGSIVSYSSDVKVDLLGVPDGPVVSEAAVTAMALGACRVLGADCSVAATGVAGPGPQAGIEPGTVWMATAVGGEVESFRVEWPFDRERTRQFTTITVLGALRRRLLKLG